MYLLLEVLNDGYKVYDTVQKCDTIVSKTLKPISGVVSLADDCWVINIVDALEQKALNCLDIKVTNLGESDKVLGNYV